MQYRDLGSAVAWRAKLMPFCRLLLRLLVPPVGYEALGFRGQRAAYLGDGLHTLAQVGSHQHAMGMFPARNECKACHWLSTDTFFQIVE